MNQEKFSNLTVLNSHKERPAKFAPHFKRGCHLPPHFKNCSTGPWNMRQPLVVQKVDNANQWITRFVSLIIISWIVIYLALGPGVYLTTKIVHRPWDKAGNLTIAVNVIVHHRRSFVLRCRPCIIDCSRKYHNIYHNALCLSPKNFA